jgi:ABC-type multidrug transport system fused ATPase/permease subunit
MLSRKSFVRKWKISVIRQVYGLLPRADLWKLGIIATLQVVLSFLDLLGIALLGILGALTVSGIGGTSPTGRFSEILAKIGILNLDFQLQIIILGVGACLTMVAKTIASVFLTRKVLFFTGRRAAVISSKLTDDLLRQNILTVRKSTSQETVYMITVGVEALVVSVIGISTVLVSDIALLFIILIGMAFYDFSTALSMILVFGTAGVFLYQFMHLKMRNIGRENTKLRISGSEKLIEMLVSFREVVIRNRQAFYVEDFGRNRLDLADKTSEMNFMPYVSKYVLESTVLIGALLISLFQFTFHDSVRAISTLTIFLAAGTRLAPALLRVQQGLIQVRQGMIAGEPTLKLISTLVPFSKTVDVDNQSQGFSYPGFNSRIRCSGVTFRYPHQEVDALSGIDLNIEPGSFVAFVGASGAGKTTLVDVILGVLEPSSGSIEIASSKPKVALEKFPGAIGYVPQDIFIHSGTIRSNVAMGFEPENFEDGFILEPLRRAQLSDLLISPEGLDLRVGERGVTLSGGQRQRLGIARALFTRPKLLILDEATSALDADTESSITKSILELRGDVTIIVVAHRLSTIKNADKIYYLERGKIVAEGNFEEVRGKSRNFDKQAGLMGL